MVGRLVSEQDVKLRVYHLVPLEVKFVRRSGRYGYGAHDYRRVSSLVVEVDTIEPVRNKSLVPGV